MTLSVRQTDLILLMSGWENSHKSKDTCKRKRNNDNLLTGIVLGSDIIN